MKHEEIVKTIENSYPKEFMVTFSDGRREKMRLFVNGSVVAQYKKRSRKWGYPIDTSGIVSIIHCKASGTEYLRRNILKMYQCLTYSGLWASKLPGLQLLYTQPDDVLGHILDQNEGWDNAARFIQDKGISGIDPTLIFSLANKGAIKSMDFGYTNSEPFADAVRNKKDYHVRFRSKYDITLEVRQTEEETKAWYSEEYKGCGNGYYYLAIDQKHAVFYEKD